MFVESSNWGWSEEEEDRSYLPLPSIEGDLFLCTD